MSKRLKTYSHNLSKLILYKSQPAHKGTNSYFFMKNLQKLTVIKKSKFYYFDKIMKVWVGTKETSEIQDSKE